MTVNPFSGVSSPRSLLIIAPDVFVSALQPLVKHKNGSGMTTVIASISGIAAFFPGVDHPESIKMAIQYAHESLSTRYVMLVGDAHMFPVRYTFFHCLSVEYSDVKVPIPTDGDYIAFDLYYSNLYHHPKTAPSGSRLPFDNWDANGNGLSNEGWWTDTHTGPDGNANPDNVDGYPDVVVGRVPAHSVADVTAYVNKIISYESSPTRYQTSRGRKFTFVGDKEYPASITTTPGLVTDSGLIDSPFVSAQYLMIENGINPPIPPFTNAVGVDVATYANQSDWISYNGHGWQHGWGWKGGGPEDLTQDSVALTAASHALPVVFAAGCNTGEFTRDCPWNSPEYVDVSGTRHQFRRPATTDGEIEDILTGKKWVLNSSNSCPGNPVILPKPNPYDFDRGLVGDQGFAHSWLIANAPGGGIAYFGEMGVAGDWMGVELETFMLGAYRSEFNPILGDIYLKAQQQYWEKHQTDPGKDVSSPRFFLGWMVFFGDPSLRLPRISNLWKDRGGQIVGAPAARSRRPDITDVFARGTDDRLWQISWDRDHWTDWTRHEDGGILSSSPVADSMGPDHVHVFARGTDGHLWQKWWTASAGWGN
jgi:hypothetical protein